MTGTVLAGLYGVVVGFGSGMHFARCRSTGAQGSPPPPAGRALEQLLDQLVEQIGSRALEIALLAIRAVDVAELLGADEREVLLRLAAWKAERVAEGRWDDTSAAAALAVLERHRDLHNHDLRRLS